MNNKKLPFLSSVESKNFLNNIENTIKKLEKDIKKNPVENEDIIKEINIIDLMIPINKKNKKKVARLIKEKDELLKKLKKE